MGVIHGSKAIPDELTKKYQSMRNGQSLSIICTLTLLVTISQLPPIDEIVMRIFNIQKQQFLKTVEELIGQRQCTIFKNSVIEANYKSYKPY
ncbi:MAG: hypothetical protein CM15mP32_5000 [Flavobacteriaceae bacterium]|nr:MAG: hypothetical protein CM15mP32_5000 [Flavobacteriaceae bacterium]